MKPSTKNFLKAMGNYTVMTCDLAGCFMRTETGNRVLENILSVESDKFRPVGMDSIVGYEDINTNPKPGEKAGATIGCLGGLALDLFSYGLIPAGFLLYDIGRSVYLDKKKNS